jgi:hypothetical protein
MIRKACTIGILAVGLALTAVHGVPFYGRLVSSAQNFEQYFRALKSANATANPVERLMFSLMLANSKTTPTSGNSTAPKVGQAAPPALVP